MPTNPETHRHEADPRIQEPALLPYPVVDPRIDDEGFMHALLDIYGGLGRFGHREHLHMTWAYVRRNGMPGAIDYVIRFIKHAAAHHGREDLYHETMTRFFIYAMGWAVAATPDADEFDAVLEENPHLLDKDLARRHWSEEALSSPTAKAVWVDPDRAPLPPLLQLAGVR